MKLEQWRNLRHLTREQLAAKTDSRVTMSTVYRIENDKVEPTLSVRQALAAALEVSVDDIDWPKPAKPSKPDPSA